MTNRAFSLPFNSRSEMLYKFLNIFFDKKDLLSQEKNTLNRFLLENNASQLEEIYDFYDNDSDFLCVNGFSGTGKAHIVDYSMSFVSPEAVILKYNCFESTILDDILLSFFVEFKKLSAQKIIDEPKAKTENFAQKINSYFAQIEKPFLIIINSFEAVLAENRQDILDFLLHLSAFAKVKIILISKTFESEYLNEQVKYDRISIRALEKSLCEKYFKFEKIKYNNLMLEEFYKHSRGYYFYTALSVKVMQNMNLSLGDLMAEHSKTFLSFDNFLKKQILSFIPATSRNLFWFLCMIRHSVSRELLKTLNLYDSEKINFLKENLILDEEDSFFYVKDYFNEDVNLSIAPNIAQKIRYYIVDLYTTQLPLKPLDRNVMISRQTMRKEIEFHSLFLPKKPKNLEGGDFDINYLAYAKGLEFDYGQTSQKEEKEEQNDETPKQEEKTVTEEANSEAGLTDELSKLASLRSADVNLKSLPFKLSEEEMGLLDSGMDNVMLEESMLEDEEAGSVVQEDFSLDELMQKAKAAEDTYHFAKAAEFYKKALKLDEDKDYSSKLPVIYTKAAQNYQKISDSDNAARYYTLAQKFYEDSGDFVKANYIKLNMAKVFYDSYKFDMTKEALADILKYEDNPPILNTKTYLQLANLEANLSNPDGAFEYYKKAVESSNESMDVETLSELYFKYALISDDKNDEKSAVEFYEKCINLNPDPKLNKFLSSAYSNIAAIYLEKNDSSAAVKNYLKAYEIDKKNDNYDGMYYSATKLASVLQRRYPEEALKFLNRAFDCAKMLNDNFYIASASLAVGDYYYDRKQDEVALKYYIFAFELVQNDFSKDNIDKIKMRLNDIKFRLGEDRFENLVSMLKEAQSE